MMLLKERHKHSLFSAPLCLCNYAVHIFIHCILLLNLYVVHTVGTFCQNEREIVEAPYLDSHTYENRRPKV